MEIKFATAEDLRQPKGGLILEDPSDTDYVLGSNDPRNLGQIIQDDGDWTPFLPAVNEIQRLNNPDPKTGETDTDWCTIFSDDEVDETIHKKKYGTEINISDKFVAVGSGTVRGQGNSMKAASEFKRTKGILFEDEKPFNRDGTMDEAYSLNTQADNDLAATRLQTYDFGYLGVNGVGQQSLIDAKKVSPLKVAVEGRYVMDGNGRMINTGTNYNHAVIIFNHVLDVNGNVVEWHVRCSETQQNLRFRGDYQFRSPYVKFFEKRPMLYKKKLQAAIGLYVPEAGGIILYKDGQANNGKPVTGGAYFKASGWTYSMATPCDEWPYPIVGYATVTPTI